MNTVLFMSSWYPTEDNPLSGSFFKEQAEVLSDVFKIIVLHIHHCSFLTLAYNIFFHNKDINKIIQKPDSTSKILDITLIHPFMEKQSFLYKIFSFVKIADFINKKLDTKAVKCLSDFLMQKSLKPDILYALTAQINSHQAQFVAKQLHIPYAIAEHSPFPVPGTLISSEIKNAIENADAFISISNDKTRQILMQDIDIHPYLVGNMINEDLFYPIRNRTENHVFIILIVAAYNFYKDYATFFSTIKFLRTITQHPFHVNIVGYNPVKDINIWNLGEEKFITLLDKYNIKELCTLIPKVNRNSMLNVYNDADVFVMTSIQEGFPVSSLEAASCGLPIYSTKCGGVEDFVDNDIGRLVNIQDYKTLAHELKKLIEGEVTYKSELIRQKTVDQYGKEAFRNKFLNIFETVITEYNHKECK